MDDKKFHPHTPAFSGGRMRMTTRRIFGTDPFTTVAITHDGGALEACRFYLPYEQGDALEEAVAAFNAVLDRREAADQAPALEAEAA